MTPKTKSSLIGEHRDINVRYASEWCEGIDDQIAADMVKVGFTANNFQWSGFWSQGDGASFTGFVHDISLFTTALEKDNDVEFPNIRALMGAGGDVQFSVTCHSRNYAHNMTVSADVEFVGYKDIHSNVVSYATDADDVRYLAACAMDALVGEELKLLEEHGMKYLRGKMDEFYEMLEKEYDYLTSDEQVWEAIVASELHLNVEKEELEDA